MPLLGPVVIDSFVIVLFVSLRYISDVKYGTPSYEAQMNSVNNNFIIANYGASQGFDTDDGSSWYAIHMGKPPTPTTHHPHPHPHPHPYPHHTHTQHPPPTPPHTHPAHAKLPPTAVEVAATAAAPREDGNDSAF